MIFIRRMNLHFGYKIVKVKFKTSQEILFKNYNNDKITY